MTRQNDPGQSSVNEIDRNIRRLGSIIYRRRALAALIDTGELAVFPLMRALYHRDEDVRRCAATALGEIGDARAVAPLCELLQDFYSEVRNMASHALIKIGEPAILPLLDTVRTVRRPDHRPFIAAIEAKFIQSGDPARQSAIETLGKLGPAALPHLLEALNAEDSALRCAAATALGAIKDVRAVPGLIVALAESAVSDHSVRICAADALGSIGDRAAVPPLCQALKATDAQVRFSAASALGRIGDERAVLSLCQAVRDRDYIVRNAASLALNMMGDAQALPLNIITCVRMTPEQKYDALDALRVRARKGELNFRHGSPTIEEYCRRVMKQAVAPALYEDAKSVLIEAQRREVRDSYLRASMTADQSEMLLRAATGENAAAAPDELVRGSQSPAAGGA
jgi:HEAT repeat protein